MKKKWMNKKKLLKDLAKAAEKRGYHDLAEKYREKLNKELNQHE